MCNLPQFRQSQSQPLFRQQSLPFNVLSRSISSAERAGRQQPFAHHEPGVRRNRDIPERNRTVHDHNQQHYGHDDVQVSRKPHRAGAASTALQPVQREFHLSGPERRSEQDAVFAVLFVLAERRSGLRCARFPSLSGIVFPEDSVQWWRCRVGDLFAGRVGNHADSWHSGIAVFQQLQSDHSRVHRQCMHSDSL